MSLQNSGGSDEDIALLENYSGGGKMSKMAENNCDQTKPFEVLHKEKQISDTGTKESLRTQLISLKNAINNCDKPIPVEVPYTEKHMTDTGTKERRILQALLKSGGSENEAAPLRDVLLATGWKMEGLPGGWMGRSLPHSGYRLALCFPPLLTSNNCITRRSRPHR